jgi:regulation of enolase protein 1 (concanavalin A-like superfamily)
MMHQGLMSLQTIQATNQQKTADDDPNIRFWFPTFFGLVRESANILSIWIANSFCQLVRGHYGL